MTPEEIKATIVDLYQKKNKFTVWCGIQIEEIACNFARLSVVVDPEKHVNLGGVAHGGLVTTLADNATGVVGATVGRRIVTSSMTISFFKSTKAGATLYADAHISGWRDNLCAVQVKVFDKATGDIVAKLNSSMVAVETYSNLPTQW